MGLDHTFRLLEFLKNPQYNLTIIHIAGTNGKGSTAAIIYNILKKHGSKVGLYTSPHLINFNERISSSFIDHEPNKKHEFNTSSTFKNVKPINSKIC